MANKFWGFFKGILLKKETSTISYAAENEGAVYNHNNLKLRTHLAGSDRELVTADQAQTLTNKTINGPDNTITNIGNGSLGTGIDAAKIADGSVSNTEFQYLGNVTSDIQTQLNNTASATALNDHITDPTAAHAGSAVSNTPSGNLAATDVQGALNELQTDVDTRATSSALTAHTGASTGVHGVTGAVVGTTDTQTLTAKTLVVASNTITTAASGNLAATELNAALAELQGDIDTRATSSALTTHTGASTGVHGVTGAVVGTTDTQTLSNKTFSDAATLAEIATPSTPASGFGKIYFKADGNAYKLNDSGTETILSGSSGGSSNKNYILNSGAEDDTSGWAIYADAASATPSDGTGGSPNVTITRNTTSPLSGSADFLLTKDAANRQGQGWSYDFTTSNEDINYPLYGYFSYKTSAGYVTADARIYLYDITNATLITPALVNIVQSTGATKHESFFNLANSTSYRIIIHVASTSATAWTMNIDSVRVSHLTDVIAHYETNAGQSITDGTAVTVDFEDKLIDTHNAVTTGSSWAFTAPVSGVYALNYLVSFSSSSWSAGDVWELYVTNSSNTILKIVYYEQQAANTQLQSFLSYSIFSLNKGDTLRFRISMDNAANTARTLINDARSNYISIVRIGEIE